MYPSPPTCTRLPSRLNAMTFVPVPQTATTPTPSPVAARRAMVASFSRPIRGAGFTSARNLSMMAKSAGRSAPAMP